MRLRQHFHNRCSLMPFFKQIAHADRRPRENHTLPLWAPFSRAACKLHGWQGDLPVPRSRCVCPLPIPPFRTSTASSEHGDPVGRCFLSDILPLPLIATHFCTSWSGLGSAFTLELVESFMLVAPTHRAV